MHSSTSKGGIYARKVTHSLGQFCQDLALNGNYNVRYNLARLVRSVGTVTVRVSVRLYMLLLVHKPSN
jgi:hypothetical protein